ncbi:hypothetical protein TOTORO_01910 [Serratia phage vB_SmaS-Totoro]|nr:hypothetical protein TOTORO_01910 [Serratia phage vB_SmaS-Totoro]
MTRKAFYIISAIILIIGWSGIGSCVYDAFKEPTLMGKFGYSFAAILVFIWTGAVIVAVGMQVKPTKGIRANDQARNH